MKLPRPFRLSKASALIAVTLALGMAFKLAAFAREVFISSRFGVSPVTDTYFSLQQLPLIVAAFIFGPFCRAFAPAYADSRSESGRVGWLAGLLLYGTLVGILLTTVSLTCSSTILHLFTRSVQGQSKTTLTILSLSYWFIIQVGLFAGIATSYGKNLWSLTITGLPYLLMTAVLGLMYIVGRLDNLSLPLSMSAGFMFTGIASAALVLCRERPFTSFAYLMRPWQLAQFRVFSRQLAASSLENVGFSANQLLILFFMARAGAGAISANNFASRIGLLGYSLLVLPLLQLFQARLCTSGEEEQRKTFRNYLLAMFAGSTTLAVIVCTFRYQIAALVYLHGKLSPAALNQVTSLLPAWLSYFVVQSCNSVLGFYLFRATRGRFFTRNMLCGYGFANLIRWCTAGAGAPWIIWCSVIGDGSALAVNLLTSADVWKSALRSVVPDRQRKFVGMENV